MSSAASAKLREGPAHPSMVKVRFSSSSRYSSSSPAMLMSQLAARSRMGCSRYENLFSFESSASSAISAAVVVSNAGAGLGECERWSVQI
jgi:hypothetical protein